MDIGPNGRISIEITFTEAVLYPWTMTGDQYERLVIRRDPVAHLRKRMPHVRFVELDEVFGVVWHVLCRSCRSQEFRIYGMKQADFSLCRRLLSSHSAQPRFRRRSDSIRRGSGIPPTATLLQLLQLLNS